MMRSLVFSSLLVSALPALAQRLDFEHSLREIRASADDRTVTATFDFTNSSERTVVIRDVDAGCTCLSVSFRGDKRSYAPGESGQLSADFEVGTFSGTVDRVMGLWLDDDPEANPSLRLTVRVHIPVLVDMEPKTLRWSLGGDPEPQVVTITMNGEDPIHVLNVTSTLDQFTPELKVIEEGRRYELTVTPTDVSKPGLAIIRLETDCAVARHRIQQAFAVVRPPLADEVR